MIRTELIREDVRHLRRRKDVTKRKHQRAILWAVIITAAMVIGLPVAMHTIGGFVWRHYKSRHITDDWYGELRFEMWTLRCW